MTRSNSEVARGGKWRRVVRHDPPLPVQEVVFDFAVTAPSLNPGSERRTDQQHGQRHAVRYVRLTAQNGYVRCTRPCPLYANSGHVWFTRLSHRRAQAQIEAR